MFGYNEILAGFLVLEGIDGAGTSTQRQLVAQALAATGKTVYDTWEPTESAIGRLIRSALKAEIDLEPGTIARLFAADRYEHIEGTNGIRQALDRGERVVCDRYVLSSLAYQGLLIGDDQVWQLNQNFPLPECLVFIDVDQHISAERRLRRGGIEEIYEESDFQGKVRLAYRRHLDALESARPDVRIGRFDGRLEIQTLHREICGFLGIAPI